MYKRIYRTLPDTLQSPIRVVYTRIHPDRIPRRAIEWDREAFIRSYFDTTEEYQNLLDELTEEPCRSLISEAERSVEAVRGVTDYGNRYYRGVYAYVWKTRSETVIETGVRDGWSTLYALCALAQNDRGQLYSVDYPITEDEEDDAPKREAPPYRATVPTLPPDKDPGWIVSEQL